MHLNLTQLRDLEYICQLAEERLRPEFGLPLEQTWLKRIAQYRKLLLAQVQALEQTQKSREPEVDPSRLALPLSGIPVRARFLDGTYGSADLIQLTQDSFFAWLRSRGGSNLWAENTVAQLLGYEPQLGY